MGALNTPLSNLLLLLTLLLLLILAGLILIFRNRKKPRPPQASGPIGLHKLLVGFLKLLGFGLAALVLVSGILMYFENYRTLQAETAPAHQNVDIPPGTTLPLEEVTFDGADGIRLAGWYVAPKNGAVIILLHGYGGTRASMLWHAETLVEAGYGVLMYDERASGESGGDHRSFGWEDGPDVLGAVNFIQERLGKEQVPIGIAGCSMGGQIALQGAIQSAEIDAVWSDGPGIIRSADNAPAQNVVHVLVKISNHMLDAMYVQKLGIPAPPPMIAQIHKIAPRPIMLVGGGTEVGVLGSESAKIDHFARFAGPNAQVWIIEEATHCDGPAQRPQEYAQRFVEFFDAVFALDD